MLTKVTLTVTEKFLLNFQCSVCLKKLIFHLNFQYTSIFEQRLYKIMNNIFSIDLYLVIFRLNKKSNNLRASFELL